MENKQGDVMAKMDVGKILSAKEWHGATRLIAKHMASFVDARAGFAVMGYVIDRTLQYHKFDEWFMTREWGAEGRPKLGFLGPGFHRGTVIRTLEKLSACKLLEVVDYEMEWSRYHIVLNAPGILERLQVLDDLANASACIKIVPVVLKVKGYFMEQCWRSDMAHMLEEVEEIARNASREARLRKRGRRDAKDLKVVWIYDAMKDYAEECEVPFSDTWTKKTYGQARNWLDECNMAGKDPRELLYDIANWWPAITEALKLQNTFIGGAVCWSLYYKYRRQIEELLAINKEQWAAGRARIGKITYIRHSTYYERDNKGG